MMISFTAYANKKFEILAQHGCVISRELVREAAQNACGTEATEQPLFFVQKKWEAGRAVRVACKREAGVVRIITFYPVVSNE